ncbi:uncharacterized protein BP5553_05286 [Venustampulla echinocandica]|uniref:C3H1-type domain-containing protein n=1 Tax=Venustampulla echinocandica TaxID=2656787 RepID=A0A370TQQ4_9HELO|nr:uncharacterized protein BP5553_05286 [Venustampulla echinocandica]RDL37853.1 hypothetical protein BP5553_05286 [Venustampulla echinocandica]
MSADLAGLALLQPSNGCSNSTQAPQPTTPAMQDSEMTSILTTNEGHSAKSPSLSPFSPGKMSAFPTGRECSERMDELSTDNSDGQAQQTPNYNNPPGTPMYSSSYSGQQFTPMNPATGAFTPNQPDTWTRADPYIPGGNSVRLSTVVPGPVFPSEAQLNVAYAYAIQRADGQYTRLMAADEIEAIDGVPPTQGLEGLIVLPAPRAPSPRRRQGNDPIVPAEIVNQLTTEQACRVINSPVSTQMQIDSIIAQSAYTAQHNMSRRQKIYCDKWIHEGVCAFTQLGCKYKHEMPHDKATQLSLGLNHGLPNWYRRAYGPPALQLTPQVPGAVVSNPSSILEPQPAHVRRLEGPSGISGPSRISGFQANLDGAVLSAYGPISPPLSHHAHPAHSAHPSHAVYVDRSRYSGRSSHSSRSSNLTSNPYSVYKQGNNSNMKGWF